MRSVSTMTAQVSPGFRSHTEPAVRASTDLARPARVPGTFPAVRALFAMPRQRTVGIDGFCPGTVHAHRHSRAGLARKGCRMMAFVYRVMGAAVLSTATYEEIEGNKNATGQAFLVVLLASLATSRRSPADSRLATAGRLRSCRSSRCSPGPSRSIVIFHIGGRLLPEPQTRSRCRRAPARTLGFAPPGHVPDFRRWCPLCGCTLLVLTSVWMLAAMVVAVRQALDYTTVARALAVSRHRLDSRDRHGTPHRRRLRSHAILRHEVFGGSRSTTTGRLPSKAASSRRAARDRRGSRGRGIVVLLVTGRRLSDLQQAAGDLTC